MPLDGNSPQPSLRQSPEAWIPNPDAAGANVRLAAGTTARAARYATTNPYTIANVPATAMRYLGNWSQVTPGVLASTIPVATPATSPQTSWSHRSAPETCGRIRRDSPSLVW